jgi:hypothetical protein
MATDLPPERPPLRRRVLIEGAVFVGFLLWAAVATRPLAAHLATGTLAGPDPLVHLWMVHWLTGHAFDPAHLFGGNIFHPTTHPALLTDLSLGTVVLVLPLRLVTSDPVLLFNLATLLAYAFGAWAFHALVFALTGHRGAALLSGFLAAFHPHQVNHAYHLNVLGTGWIALFLLGLHLVVRRGASPGPWRRLLGPVLLAGVSFALTAQTNGYYGVAVVAVALAFAAVHAPALRRPQVAAALAAAAVVGTLLTLPYLQAFRALQDAEGLRRPPGLSVTLAFRPERDLDSIAYLYRTALGYDGERLFPGLLPLVLAAVAVRRRAPGAGFYLAAIAALLLLALGPRLEAAGRVVTLPYAWLFAVPPLNSMRHPFTFAAVANLLLMVLAGMGWSRLAFARRPWSGPAVLALAVLETLAPPREVRSLPAGVPPVYELLKSLPPGPVLEVPVFDEETMLWAARHGLPVVNGVGAFAPVQALVLERYVRNHWVEQVPVDVDASRPTPYLLGRFPVRYVILPTGRKHGYEALAAAFDRSRSFRPVAVAPDGDRIYEVRRTNGR